MRRLYRALAVALLLMVPAAVSAQSDMPSTGCDPHRTRLVPYATAEAAEERAMTRQRYMQPIVEWTEADDGVLRGEYTFPFSWLERHVLLRVEHVGVPYEVWINGKHAGGSANGFAAAEYNITKLSREDKNRVELRLIANDKVRSIENFDRGSAPQPTAYVISQPRVRVRDISYRTTLGKGGVVNVDFSAVMQNQTLGAKQSTLYYELYLNDTIRLGGGHRDVALGMHGVDTMRFGSPVPDSVLWSAASPTRLSLRLKNRIAGRDVEHYDLPLALRQLEWREGKLLINGSEQSVEWYCVSPGISVEELHQIYDEGYRTLRFTAGAITDELLEECDRLGLYVAVTAPINSSSAGKSRKRGGNPSNNPKWRADYVERTLQMAHTTKRHPSVVAYFLADDSANGICLYESYLALKAVAGDRAVFYDGGEWNSDR